MQDVYNNRFVMDFDNGQHAEAVRVKPEVAPEEVIKSLNLPYGPCVFITGGAGDMKPDDIRRTQEIMQAVADFAQQKQCCVIDGGTEAGVMQMVGAARNSQDHDFTLVGVAPHGLVSYPGYSNPNEQAQLEDSHSHFVLVDGDDWGSESEMLIKLTKALSMNGAFPVMGILINGGSITKREVTYATQNKLPLLVLEGSGRFADEVATAFRTGKAKQTILRAILAGGDIQIVSTLDGPEAVRKKLEQHFAKK